MLAGISADYYLRLERGRDRNPSAQVLEAIARVLQLDDEHVAHLLSLVAPAPRRRRRARRRETVPPTVLTLLDSLTQPAFVEGRYFDVLASNALAQALSPAMTVGRNHLRDLLLEPAEQDRFPEWQSMSECLVASLRQAVGSDVDDPRLIELTGELALASPHFRHVWARHEVREQRGAPVTVRHPLVGELTLHRQRLAVDGTDGLRLVVHFAEPGSADADRLSLLASASLPVAAPRTTGADADRTTAAT